jgi:hypothetical protein
MLPIMGCVLSFAASHEAGNTVGYVLLLTLYITVRVTPIARCMKLYVRVVLRMGEFVSRMMDEQPSDRYITPDLA